MNSFFIKECPDRDPNDLGPGDPYVTHYDNINLHSSCSHTEESTPTYDGEGPLKEENAAGDFSQLQTL